jgi:hypothetical protein
MSDMDSSGLNELQVSNTALRGALKNLKQGIDSHDDKLDSIKQSSLTKAIGRVYSTHILKIPNRYSKWDNPFCSRLGNTVSKSPLCSLKLEIICETRAMRQIL